MPDSQIVLVFERARLPPKTEAGLSKSQRATDVGFSFSVRTPIGSQLGSLDDLAVRPGNHLVGLFADRNRVAKRQGQVCEAEAIRIALRADMPPP